MTVRQDVLAAIASQPGITTRELTEGASTIRRMRIYSAIDKLQARGDIVAEWGVALGRPARRFTVAGA